MPDETSIDRFVEAQTLVYSGALAEIRRGTKRSHWMWYIFPQLTGLGHSITARHFAIRSIEEARLYLDHPILGARYRECVAALQDLPISDPAAVFGDTDAQKLCSSLTLFEEAEQHPLFNAALARWFGGKKDQRTLSLLQAQKL